MMNTTELNSEYGELLGELTVTFVIAAKMTDAEITPDSDITNGIRAVMDLLADKYKVPHPTAPTPMDERLSGEVA